MEEIILCCLALNFLLSGIESVHYVRVGCLEDRGTRILREKATYLNVNSPWHCQKFCGEYKYFGLEAGKTCFCGNEIILPIKLSQKCTMYCEGNKLLICGGVWAIDVYRRNDIW
ncbi:sialate:O-sulfotransferase 1-like isoform X2 [Crassostrea virginica]